MQIGTKNYQKKILVIRIAILLCLVVIVFLSISVYKRYKVEREMDLRRAEAEGEYHEMEKRQAEIYSEVEYLRQDSSIEAEIRRNFDVAKEGEAVVILTEEEGGAVVTDNAVSVSPEEEDKPWYAFW